MKYYAEFNENRNIKAFYCDAINPRIPDGAIKISEEDWKMYSANPSHFKLSETGVIVAKTEEELAKEEEERLSHQEPIFDLEQYLLDMEYRVSMIELIGG